MPNILQHPGWLFAFLRDGGLPRLENIIVPGQGPMSLMDVGSALARAVVSWDDLKWIRELWKGPIIIKGVLIGDDAKRAVDEGATAVVVSNHGGRQLDCVSATLRALPEVVAAVNGRMVDLLILFRGFNYYHPDQCGSASMKQVLPALTRKDYEGLEIREGGAASREFLRVTFTDVHDSERSRVRRALNEYCGQDTEGMVWILDSLSGVC